MKTVLVAMDFSVQCEEVERVGYEIAKATGASVTLITIVNKDLNYTAAYTGLFFADQWEERLYLAKEKLEKIKQSHPEVETNIISYIGYPKQDLLEAASDPNVSYVVLGTHGRTGFSHLVMGGTTEYMVQHSVKPILVVPFRKSPH